MMEVVSQLEEKKEGGGGGGKKQNELLRAESVQAEYGKILGIL